MIYTLKFWRYFLINAILVTAFIVMFFHNFHGENKGIAFDIMLLAVAFALPVIFFQYKLLNLKNNWIYKALIFYSGMIIFLFLLGVAIGWNEKVGSNEAGTWLARLDSGFRFAFMGQFFGGLLGYPIILLINFILKDLFFEKRIAKS